MEILKDGMRKVAFGERIKVVLLAAFTLLLLVSSWVLPPFLVGLLGLLFVIIVTIKGQIKGGLLASFWAGGIVSLAYVYTGGVTFNVVVSILVYFVIALVLGKGLAITSRYQSALQADKKYFESLLNSTHDPLHVIDRSYNIVFVNKKVVEWLESFGFNGSIVNKPLAEAMPFLPGHIYEEYRRVFDSGEPLSTEESTDLHGEKYYTETTKSPVFGQDGSVEKIITVTRDITDRKHAEKNMVNLVENAPDMIVRFNTKLQHIYCNDAVTHYFEKPKEFFIGKSFKDLSPDPENLEKSLLPMQEVLEKSLQTGEPQQTQHSLQLASGYRDFFTRIVPEKGTAGNVESLLAVTQDITALVLAKEDLDKMSQEYETVFHGTQSAMFLVKVVDGGNFYFVRNNRVHQETTGLKAEVIRNKSPREVLGDELGCKVLLNYRRCLDAGEPVSYQETLALSGIERDWHTTLTPIFDNKGKITHIVGSSEDVTERNKVVEALQESEQKFRSIVEAARTVSLVVTDLDSFVEEFSPGAEEIFGYKKEEIIGRHVAPLHHPSEVKKFGEYIDRLRTERNGFTIETRLVKKSGESFPALFTLQPIFDYGGELTGTLGIAVDVSELKAVEKELRYSEQKFRSYVDNAPDGIFVADAKGRYLEANEMASRITGYTEDELTGKYIHELIPEAYHEQALEHFYLVQQQGWAYGEMPFLHKDGEHKMWGVSAVKLSNNRFLAFVRDVTERKQAEEKIRYLSFYDNLTGLHNRLYMEEEMKRLDTARQLPVSVIMADLNGLKLINDTYGHDLGDKMLKNAAEILRFSCRSEDIIARWGGDEFLILLPQTGEEEARIICRRIKEASGQAYIKNMPVSMALGVGGKDVPGKELAYVLNEAEKDMYRKKLAESRSEKSAVIDTLLNALGGKSFETADHIARMQEMASLLVERLKLSDSDENRLMLLIKLHDIGKINIPEEVLTKEEPLTDEEWKLVKSHPENGYRIARATEEFSHLAEEIWTHHENWDGSGYPRGLKGEEIPYLSRIMALVDACEVMSSGRPYKKALEQEQIAGEIKRCAGKQFDPCLVEEMLAILNKAHIY